MTINSDILRNSDSIEQLEAMFDSLIIKETESIEDSAKHEKKPIKNKKIGFICYPKVHQNLASPPSTILI